MYTWLRRGAAAVLAVSLLAGQALSASAGEAPAVETQTLKIATLSDTHYLSPDLIADTQDFQTHLNSDRKMFAESDTFLDALLDVIAQDDPDVLLITGDLTKDGEGESHQALADKLEAFREEMPDLHIYITPGNHDLNNSNGMNFNPLGEGTQQDTPAVPATRTTQEDFKRIYGDLTFNDPTVIATFTPADGKQGGGLSYVARPKEGFTIISIDSARYSWDNTESGADEHETSGAISPELKAWVLDQIAQANYRGDTVIGMEHHGLVPHFEMEPELLPMYLVNGYEELSRDFANAGMHYVFTGHMHANDIASMTTEEGNTLYDIETGSVVTYPSPARFSTLTRTINNGVVTESLAVTTHLGVGPVQYTSPVTGETTEIPDITAYGQEHGFSADMLTTTLNGFLHDFYQQALEQGGLRSVLESLIGSLLGSDLTLEQAVDLLVATLPTDPAGNPEESELSLYYDPNGDSPALKVWYGTGAPGSNEDGIWVAIPIDALKEALDPVLEDLNVLLKDTTVLDGIIANLVDELVGLTVTEDKTLLDFVNYIYQSHLGGQDSGQQPDWVVAATEQVRNGQLLDTVLQVAASHLGNGVNTLLDHVRLNQLLGAAGFDILKHEWKPMEGRTPLIQLLNENTEDTIALVALLGGLSNIGDDYSVADLIAKVNTFGGIIGINIDIPAMVEELLLGTPADGENPGEEGLIDGEMKTQLNGWLLRLVETMGTDTNYPEDNNTTIQYQWKLSTNWDALNAAIAQAQGLDMGRYTQSTAQAVSDALSAALALNLNDAQAEIDSAALALNNALAALEEKPATTPDEENPDGDGDIQQPGGIDTPAPDTGDGALLFPAFLVLAGCGATSVVLWRARSKKDRSVQ